MRVITGGIYDVRSTQTLDSLNWFIFFFILFSFATRAGSPQQREPITLSPCYLTHPVNGVSGENPRLSAER